MHWVHDANLSMMSDADYLAQIIHHLTAQIHANPTDKRAYFLRGNAYLDQRSFQLAIDDYSRAIELDSQDPVTYNNRGVAYRSCAQPERAIADYHRALALDETYRDAYNNLGLALSDLGEAQDLLQLRGTARGDPVPLAYSGEGYGGRHIRSANPGLTLMKSANAATNSATEKSEK